MKNIILIIGARPNFVKAFPVYEALKEDFKLTLIHTGQHFDTKMSDVFFNQLKFPKPDIHLTLEKKTKAGNFDDKLYLNNHEYLKNKDDVIEELMNYDGDLGQLGEIRDKLKIEFKKINPDLVFVFGDVTSTLAAGLATKNLNIELAHVESGLRSNDIKMPEEVNRILTDHITKYYFVTEQSGVDNLKKDGITENVYLVGNTMIDTQKKYLQQALNTKYNEKLGVKSKEYVLITLHRPSNVDDLNKLRETFDDFEELSKTEKLVYPIHPRTKNNLEKLGYLKKVHDNPNIILDEPLGYLEFTCLMANCKYIVTDSGGLQEESTALDIPCFTLRENTERPSTLIENHGTNQMINKIGEIELRECKGSMDLWDGKSSVKIYEKIYNIFDESLLVDLLISNLYPGHLEVIESIIIKFLPNICSVKYCNIDIELFDYSKIEDKSKKPDDFINYMKNKYKNINFQKRNIDYDYIIDNTVIGSKSPAQILKANAITHNKDFLKGNYPKNRNIIISDSKKHYYISHRIEEEFFKNIPNVYYLTPLCKSKNYFIPSILPEINKKTSEKLICAVQGNLWIKSRNFESLIPLLETYDNFYIKLIGRGCIPECLTNYTKRIIMCNNLEWNDYHKAFEDVYWILPLIDDTFTHNYFTTSLTSSISYAEGYNLKCFYHKKLDNIYKIENSVVYDSNNMVQQFQKVIDNFYNKKNMVILMNCHGDHIKNILKKSFLNLDYNISHISYVNKIKNPIFSESELNLIKNADFLILQYIKNDRGCINHNYIIKNLINKEAKYFICPHYTFSGYLYDDMEMLVKPTIKSKSEIDILKESMKFDKKKVLDFLNSELEHLKELDALGDFILYDFVKNNYKYNKVFENRGHPNIILFYELANQILKKLNYKSNIGFPYFNKRLGAETLIFDDIKRILELKFNTHIQSKNIYIPYLASFTIHSLIPYCNRYGFDKINISNFNNIDYKSKKFYGYYGDGTTGHDGLYFLTDFKSSNENIAFIFHGVASKLGVIDPISNIKYLKKERIIFRGYDFKIDNTDIVCISDYLINKYDEYCVGYFQSTNKYDCDFLYSELIKSILSHKKYKSIVFTGTSVGSFSSIKYASKFEGIALISNPQLYLIDGKMNAYQEALREFYNFSQVILNNNDKILYKDNDIENIILKGNARKIIIHANDEDNTTNMDIDKLELFVLNNKLNDKIKINHFKKKGNPNSHAHNFRWSEDNHKHNFFIEKTLKYHNKSITFASIFYEKENSKEAIIRQIKSFKYYKSNFNIEFIIVYNELEELNTDFKNVIMDNKPDNINSIKILNRNDIYKENNCKTPKFWKNDYGYFHQEIIKLLIFKFVTTEYYIQLDDKNFFINETNDDHFFKKYKPIIYTKDVPDKVMDKYYLNSLEIFNCNKPENIEYCSITPFIFITKCVEELINYFIDKDKDLKDLFNKIGYYKVTEFTLYQAFIIKRNYMLNYEPYKFTEKNLNIWDITDNLNILSLKEKYNMIGLKFKVIEYIKNNEKMNEEFLLISDFNEK
ncbi:UDP-N-acetylglucosamine 2-epimerase [Chrysochromulina ericina virus CeV-01B]|uniref:UDP-N-acetylglucosamine 2-epimerase n=1 Tax=Chrysochromulina ericina virus CeV-01B TaxID=3070830 RepID=A0A0N9R0B2_9VIRU|nr:UDP-N-acetylglucosamine 2-epimerase [Chrysochromulina ericina virus]ALH22910.1 UDP-N-acetylglucosamine 2-epimerase [Chrysochromulina ericina virus CeV-01B]